MVSIINKLFRDRLVPQQLAAGRTVSYTKISWQQLIDLLYDKAEEELKELKNLVEQEKEYTKQELETLKTKIISEAKDVLEVIASLTYLWADSEKISDYQTIIDAIAAKYDIAKQVITEAQQKDSEERGSFREWWYVEKLDIPPTDPWYEYFKNKYPQEETF